MSPVLNPPVVQLLPTADLVVPEWNPRKYIEEGPLQDLIAHLEAGGFVERILVWGGDGKSVISGQRRLLAHRRLGKTHIEAEILDITLEAARKLANSSNEGAPLYWLDRYEGWEPYLAPDSGMTEDEAGATVGVAASWISRAKGLLAVLSPASRRLIREQLEESPSNGDAKNKGNNDPAQTLGKATETLKKRISENPEKWLFAEDAAFQLTLLWDKRSLEDAQALVEKALPVILAREMTAPQIKALVKWVSEGGKPESFKLNTPSPLGRGFEGTQGHFPVSAVGETGRVRGDSPVSAGRETGRVRGDQAGPSAPVSQAGRDADLHTQVGTAHLPPDPQVGGQGLVVPSLGAGGNVGTKLGSAVASHELGKKLHIPTQVLNRLLPHFTRLFQKVIGLFQWMGVKNKLVAALLAFFLVMFVSSTLIGQAKRLVRGLWNMAFSRTAITEPVRLPAPRNLDVGGPVPRSSQSVGGGPRRGLVAPSRGAERNGGTKGGSVPLSTAPQGGGQGLVVPSQGDEVNGVTKGGSVQTPSPNLAAWAASDAPLAGEFANRFYGVSCMNWDGTMDYFKAHMTEDEAPVFIQQYFPATLLRQFQEKRLVNTFEASKPVQLVKVEGTKDEFLAQGFVTTVSHLNRAPQTLSKKPVALVMEFWHVEGFGTRVGKAAEVSPEQAQALIQNAPSLSMGNPKEPGQKDATDPVGKFIVNTANNAATNVANDAVSQGIKKLLPF